MLPVIQDGFGDRDLADFLINNIDNQIHPDDSVSLFLPMYIRCRWLLHLLASPRTAMPYVRLQMNGYWPHSHCLRSECARLRECQIICVNCPDHNSDFIELSKSCKGGNPCLDRIPAIRVMIIKQSMRIFRQFTYTDYLTRPRLPKMSPDIFSGLLYK